ncbi:transposase [Streptomyces sp. 049-1]|uniref:transposase n=1 Tax=Streptomyces sp. 049-1 TaxID=2789264 RepID=UPI00397F079C
MSPLVGVLTHIGNQEDLWLVREAGGLPAVRPNVKGFYDAFQHARSDRPAPPSARPGARARICRCGPPAHLGGLQTADTSPDNPERLLADGFVFCMLAQHEQRHDETMLAAHQLSRGPTVLHASPPPPAPADEDAFPREVLVPAGPCLMGTSTEPWALDNERPHPHVQVAASAVRPLAPRSLRWHRPEGRPRQPRAEPSAATPAGSYAAGAAPSGARQLTAWIRGHWLIENQLHHVRDRTFREDASKIRIRHLPRVVASLRYLAIGVHLQDGHTNIAAALRRTGRDHQRPLTAIGLT